MPLKLLSKLRIPSPADPIVGASNDASATGIVDARAKSGATMGWLAAPKVIGASVLLWLVTLYFFVLAAGGKGEEWNGFWVLVRDHEPPAAWAGVGVLVAAGALYRPFMRCDWERLAVWIERYLVGLCAVALVIYAALAVGAFQRFPMSTDEYGVWSESHVFAAGQLSGWVPPPLLDWILPWWTKGEFFAVSQSSGHFTASYWPGLAISQIPFTLLGVTWLCNPVWGALGLWGVFRLAKRLTGSSEAAAWAWVLTLCSPVIAINAASFYAMPAHFTCGVFYALSLLRDDRWSAFWAGVLGGFALTLHNPVPHLAFALPWVVMVAWKRRALLMPLVLGYLIFVLGLGLGWSAYLDSFDASSYAKTARAANESLPFAEMLGRLATVARLPTPYIVLARLTGIAKTMVWAVPGLLVLAWYGWRILSPRAAARLAAQEAPRLNFDRRGLRLLGISLFLTFSIYWLVPFDQGFGWGFRYVHSAWFALAMLGGIALASAPRGAGLRAFFAALCALSLTVMLPLRAYQVENLIARHQAQLPAVPATAPASITFVEEGHGWFSSALVRNDPFLRNENWRLLSHGAAPNAQLARQYLVDTQRVQYGEWGEIWGWQRATPSAISPAISTTLVLSPRSYCAIVG